MTSAAISTNIPTPRALRRVGLLASQPPAQTIAEAPWGVSATRAKPTLSQSFDEIPIDGHGRTQSDSAELCLADPPQMVHAKDGIASRGIVRSGQDGAA